MVTDSIEPFHSGGKEDHFSELSRRLADDFDVHVYTMKWWDGPARVDRDGVAYHALCPVVPLYRNGRRSAIQAIVFGLACLRLLGCRFSVVETDNLPYLHLFTLRLATWIRGNRFVVTWHEVVGARYLRSYLGIRWLMLYATERIALRLPDAIVAASEHTADRIRQLLGPGTDVATAPNGVDLPAIQRVDVAAPAVDVVTVGRLVGHTRVDLILQVIDYLERMDRPVTCRIIGSGPARDEDQAQAARLGLADEAEFLNDVTDRSQMFALMKSARVFVSTSEREGFGIAALEGLACGLPVVVTSAPGNLAQHVVARSTRGTVCEPDLGSISAAVRGALDARPNGTESESEWLVDYSWSSVADRVSEVLRPEAASGFSGGRR